MYIFIDLYTLYNRFIILNKSKTTLLPFANVILLHGLTMAGMQHDASQEDLTIFTISECFAFKTNEKAA